MFAVTCIFILFACPQQEQHKFEMIPIASKSEIVGKWKEKGKTIEIFEDGKIVYKANDKKAPVIGSYELVDGNILRASYEGIGTQDYKAYMYQGRIILHGITDGTTARLTRVPDVSQ